MHGKIATNQGWRLAVIAGKCPKTSPRRLLPMTSGCHARTLCWFSLLSRRHAREIGYALPASTFPSGFYHIAWWPSLTLLAAHASSLSRLSDPPAPSQNKPLDVPKPHASVLVLAYGLSWEASKPA